MPTVPRFIIAFQRRFEKTLSSYMQERKRSSHALDVRLDHPVSLTLRTLKGGKRLRPLLVSLGYEAVGGRNPTVVIQAGLMVELFHSFALIHDDIMDRAITRRGSPTIHEAVRTSSGDAHAGLGTAVLSGDLLLSTADRIDRIPVPKRHREDARTAFQQMIEETILGQQLEFDLTRQKRVSLDDIVRAMIYKSGRYSIEWPLKIGAILGGAKTPELKRFSTFSIPLGLAFQLRDDILGIFGNPKETGKSHDSDIREGKRTLLVYYTHQVATAKERKRLWNTLGNQNASSRDISYVRALMKKTDAYKRTLELSKNLTDAGLIAISQCPIAPSAKRKLEELARYLLVRER
ncbi:MAG: polyprenyl synthetase family protein [Candidatus Kerfeldbacteria bacterium]